MFGDEGVSRTGEVLFLSLERIGRGAFEGRSRSSVNELPGDDSDSKDVICPSFIVKRVIYNTWPLFKWLICVMHCHYNPFK